MSDNGGVKAWVGTRIFNLFSIAGVNPKTGGAWCFASVDVPIHIAYLLGETGNIFAARQDNLPPLPRGDRLCLAGLPHYLIFLFRFWRHNAH